MRQLVSLLTMALLLVGAALFAQEAAKPKTYSLVLQGAVWGGCAGQLASAISSVDGAKVIVPPKQGTGDNAQTIAVVELSGKANLAAVTAAVEGAQTPHRDRTAPDVDAVIPGKLKPSATPEAIMGALKKADLVEE